MENAGTVQRPVNKTKWKKWLFSTLLILILISVIAVVICGMSYSSGTRSGVVIKLSRKGYIFKTYEGELNLGGISEGDGTLMPTRIWKFSVHRKDSEVYDAITKSQGKHVRLYYKEVLKNFFWQSETPYLIEKVEVVK
ncbi:MAG: hypothetical protein K0S53_1129 [Bacteroidetes bacterium]|jgi:hypothetical protein|nr:hypothetical protein [Bacteroidota bacterium]MDF2451917.1 hypothetical protein [Bacteroidota bacterium]